jgi:hypothetical protein
MGSHQTESCESCGQPATWYVFCESCRRMRNDVGMVPHVCDQCEATRMSYGPEDLACVECPDEPLPDGRAIVTIRNRSTSVASNPALDKSSGYFSGDL